jgi:hypothetical protein
LKHFGEIDEIKLHWAKNYLLVVYKESSSAKEALSTLQSLEGRKQMSKQCKQNLLSKGISNQSILMRSIPKTSYYARWAKYRVGNEAGDGEDMQLDLQEETL